MLQKFTEYSWGRSHSSVTAYQEPRAFFIFQVSITEQYFREISQANSINPFPLAPCN